MDVSYVQKIRIVPSLKTTYNSHFNINPTRFQKGDIVELTVSFFCVRTRLNSLKMMTSLKSITLLDDHIQEVRTSSLFPSRPLPSPFLFYSLLSIFLFLMQVIRCRYRVHLRTPGMNTTKN